MPGEPYDGVIFASPSNARASSRREGEAIVASQVEYLKRLSDELLRQAEALPAGERISWADAEAIWAEMLADRDAWISTHPPDGFWAYLEERRARFPLPI
jgi:hypothetical protein